MFARGNGQGESRGRRATRLRPRLSRTLSRARWREYDLLLRIARGQEYQVVGVESWLAGFTSETDRPVLLIRHDVDQHPRSALRMAEIERRHGIRSTWYFRWRTAHPRVINAIREAGHDVGLHYETLTRIALERGVAAEDAATLIREARALLARELKAFNEQFGPARSACPHGDTRLRGVHNGVLLRGEDLAPYGIEWDVNDAIGERGIDVWLTDRSNAEGRWQDGTDAIDLVIDRRTPMLLVVHPNNWVSGPALWWDRVVPGGTRTRSDAPVLMAAHAVGERASDSPPSAPRRAAGTENR